MILDNNHRATKAILTNQKMVEIIYINREYFFLDLQFFPSKFDFYACFLVIVLHEMDQINIRPSVPNFIPQSFFPPKLPNVFQMENHWERNIFRM